MEEKDMKKYNVVFATSYKIEANDETEAEEIAFEKFQEDLGTESETQLGLFGCHVEKDKVLRCWSCGSELLEVPDGKNKYYCPNEMCLMDEEVEG